MKPEIRQVTSNAEMQAFLAVPSLVYGKGNVPPTAGSYTTSMRFVPVANPSLQHIRFANFVAIEDGVPVGRITASIDSLNPRPEEGFWGCFECVDNPEVAKALLDAAAQWLKNQNKTIMIGPATLNTNQQVGLMIKGFKYEPQREIPHNPPYYQNLVEDAGLTKIHDLESFNWQLPESLPRSLEKEVDLPGIIIRPVNYSKVAKEAKIFQEINNKVFSEMWGFIPMTLSESRGFLMSLALAVPANFFLIAEVDKKPAAMFLSIPHQKPNRSGTGGVIRLALAGIVPEYRQKGLHRLMLKEFYKQCRKFGFTTGEVSQVAESNHGIKNKIIGPMFGGEVIKLHRVYKRDLN